VEHDEHSDNEIRRDEFPIPHKHGDSESSCLADGECLYASMGMLSWPGAFPDLSADRHSSSSAIVSWSSGLAFCSRSCVLSEGGLANFLVRNSFQEWSS
jgi:hypothetical protein